MKSPRPRLVDWLFAFDLCAGGDLPQRAVRRRRRLFARQIIVRQPFRFIRLFLMHLVGLNIFGNRLQNQLGVIAQP